MERMCQFSFLSLKYGVCVCVFYFSSLKFKMSPILSFCLLSLTFFISMWSRIQIWGTKIEPKLYFREKKDIVQVLFFFHSFSSVHGFMDFLYFMHLICFCPWCILPVYSGDSSLLFNISLLLQKKKFKFYLYTWNINQVLFFPWT